MSGSIEQIPEDLVYQILVRTCAAQELRTIATVCKGWYKITKVKRCAIGRLCLSPFNVIDVFTTNQLYRIVTKGNQMGDEGVSALASACASGALPLLEVLLFTGDRIGNDGVKALASACASGALKNLKHLWLGGNIIGDDGVQALASACASGALPSLQKLYISENPFGDAGKQALKPACQQRGIETPYLS